MQVTITEASAGHRLPVPVVMTVTLTAALRDPNLNLDPGPVCIPTAAAQVVATGQEQQSFITPIRARRLAILEKIHLYIIEHMYQRQLSPLHIQEAFALSRPTLYRLFQADGGLAGYIRSCRLQEAARELIGEPGSAITDIAYRAGFNSGSDFSRAFRRCYGMTPRAFRQAGR